MEIKLAFGIMCHTTSAIDMERFYTDRGGVIKTIEHYPAFGKSRTSMKFEFEKKDLFKLGDCTHTIKTGELEVNGVRKKWFDKDNSIMIKDVVLELLSVGSKGSYGWNL